MQNPLLNQEGEDPLKTMKDFGSQWSNYFNSVQRVTADYEHLQQRVMELENEKKVLEDALETMKKGDEWSSRVTYEAVVEQIAACEDAKERDEARKLIEPLLKKEMANRFRKDIRRRAKELNEVSSNILIQQAEVKVQSPGNNIAHTIINKE